MTETVWIYHASLYHAFVLAYPQKSPVTSACRYHAINPGDRPAMGAPKCIECAVAIGVRIPARNAVCFVEDPAGEPCIDEDGSGRRDDERCPDCPLGPGTIPYGDEAPKADRVHWASNGPQKMGCRFCVKAVSPDDVGTTPAGIYALQSSIDAAKKEPDDV